MAVVHKLNSALVTFTGILSIMLVLTQPARSDSSVPHDFVDGQPATASEVNENFTAILEAIDDHWTRHPDRYYPDWRYDPGFYLTLPTLGGFWKGRLLSDYHSLSTSWRNLNFINYYDSASNNFEKRIWLGITVIPSVDVAISLLSKVANGSLGEAYPVYSFDMSHAKDGTGSLITYSKDGDLDALYGPSDSDWRKYLEQSIVEETLEELYEFLKLSSETVSKACDSINIHLNADQSVTVTGTNCVESVYGE